MKCKCGGELKFRGLAKKGGKTNPAYTCDSCKKTFINNSANNTPVKVPPNAIKLYEEFNMKKADSVLVADMSLPSETNPLVHLGKISGVIYISDKEGTKGQQYIHETEPPYPDFFVTADGKTFLIAGGRMIVKDGWLYY